MKLKKCFIFLAVINFSVIFFSCKEPVRGYFEYWSSTCQVAGVEYISPCTVINGKPNVSAQGDSNNEVVIYLNLINPEQHNTLAKNSVEFFTLSCGTIISQEQINPDTIKIEAKLDDAYEGETITLSGCLWPDNRTGYDDVAALKKSNPELFYSTSFIQNTPPENIKNLNNQESSHKYYQNTQKHHVSFDIPDRSKNKNKDAQFEICCYSKEDGSFLGKQIVPMPQSGNSISYCFESIQAENLYYDFTVQVIGKHGLKSEIVSTNGALGVQILNEPGITFSLDYNGKKDSENYEYIEVDSANDKVTCTISAENGSTIEGDINGTTIASSTNKYEQQLGTGKYTINATIRRDGSRPVSVTKRVAVIKKISDPAIEFSINPNRDKDSQNFEYIEVDHTSDTVECTIRSETGTTISGRVGSSIFSEDTNEKKVNLNCLTSNEISVTVHKENCNDVVLTRKIKVVQKLQKPSIVFYKEAAHSNIVSSTNDNEQGNQFNSYTNYDVKVADGGLLYYVVTPGTGETLTIKDGNTPLENSGYLDLGSHSLSIKVEKSCYNPQTFYEDIYVQGILSDADINVTETSGNGAHEVRQSSNVFWVFSYLKTDGVNYTVTAGNYGNTIDSVSVGGNSVTNYFLSPSSSDYQITVVQKRDRCKTRTTTRYVKVKIKTIRLYVSSALLYCAINDGGTDCQITGNVYLYKTGSQAQPLVNFNQTTFDTYPGNEWPSFSYYSYTFDMNSPSDSLTFHAKDMIEYDPGTSEMINECIQYHALSSIVPFYRLNAPYAIQPQLLCTDYPDEYINFWIQISYIELD